MQEISDGGVRFMLMIGLTEALIIVGIVCITSSVMCLVMIAIYRRQIALSELNERAINSNLTILTQIRSAMPNVKYVFNHITGDNWTEHAVDTSFEVRSNKKDDTK